ncbi:MAG: fused MFS/spermidine synthase [Pseudomonadota bacterium]
MSGTVITPEKGDRLAWDRFGASPYIATIFLSAGLVFLVQPMFAKMATPLLGGAPNVWNVSLVCFQAALLLGYAYAHLLNHFVASLRTQILIHTGLLGLAALVLPFQLSEALGLPNANQPTLWLIGVFAISIAPPFAVISATAPLIQSWYSRSGREDAHDPYHLYGASNIGSLVGLIAYPVILEPLLSLNAQTNVWTLGYATLALLLIACGVLAYRTGGGALPAMPATETASAPQTANAIWRQRLWWLTCAFIPSSLLVGVTTLIATEIASVPFLWVLPLLLYISTFILVFSQKPAISLASSKRRLVLAVAMALLALPPVTYFPYNLPLFIHLATLFLAAHVCHGVLAEDRPEAGRLTEFYLIMSLGGVLGGAFNALLVPILFNSIIEYPLLLLAVLFIRPGVPMFAKGREQLWVYVALIALAAAIVLRMTVGAELGVMLVFRGFLIAAILALVMSQSSRAGAAIIAACAWGIGMLASPITGGFSDRSFFGVAQIQERDGHRILFHGMTVHGTQALDPDLALRPTTYYAPETPIGQVFGAYDAPGEVAIVGLGTGSVACYAEPGQTYTYYEIDPLVAKLASDPEHFTYLSECTPGAEIIVGDGRLNLAAQPEGKYDLMLLDAFSSSSVPTHLLTREAIDLYLSRLTEDGVLVMHVSNKFMPLHRTVARITDEMSVPALYQFYTPPKDDKVQYHAHASQVVIIARDEATLAQFKASEDWVSLEGDGKRAWTDDYTNVLGAMLERYF